MLLSSRNNVLCLALAVAALAAVTRSVEPALSAMPAAEATGVGRLESRAHFGGAVGALAVAGDRVFAGAGPRVVELDISGIGDPREVGASSALDGDVYALAEAGGLVFAGYGIADEGDPNGLAILDGRGGRLGSILARLPLTGRPVAVWAKGDVVTVATRKQVRDSQPYPTVTLMPFPTSTPSASRARGSVAPDVVTYHGGEILRVDVSAPAAPRIVGRLALPEVPVDMEALGDQLYVLTVADPQRFDGPASIVRVSLADATRPDRLGTFPINDGPASAMDADGGFVYVVGDLIGLRVLDATDPDNPHQVAQLDLFSTTDVLATAGRVYVSDVTSSLIFDIADPLHPTYVGEFDGPVTALTSSGNHLFGALTYFGADAPFFGNRNAVGVFDLPPDGAPPKPVGRWMTASDVTSAAVAGPWLYLDFGGAQLVKVAAKPEATPSAVAIARWQSSSWSSSCNAMALLPDYLALTTPCGSPSALYIARLDPSGAPVPVGHLSLEANALTIAADGGLIGIPVRTAFGFRGPTPVPVTPALRLYDLVDPAKPHVAGEVPIGDAAVGVAMRSGMAYLANTHEITIVDISSPGAPVELARSSFNGGLADAFAGNGVALGGVRMAVRTRTGVQLFDVSDPHTPLDIGRIPAVQVTKLAMSDQLLAVAKEDSQQRIFVSVYDLDHPLDGPLAQRQFPDQIVDVLFQEGRLVVVTGQSGVYWLSPEESTVGEGIPSQVWLPFLRNDRQ